VLLARILAGENWHTLSIPRDTTQPVKGNFWT
jgi:hypothetical protein